MHRATVRILFVCICVMTFCLAANAAGPITGKFDIYFEITVESVPANTPISCTLTVSVEGEQGLFEDSMSVTAAPPNGNHVVCTVPMNYSWMLNNPGSDIVSLSYTVVAAATGLPYRQDSQSATMPVPATGTASHIYVTVVL